MSVTFGELKTRISDSLLDPDRRTFTEAMVEEMVFRALSEVGRIVPEQFVEDLTPVAYQMTYTPRFDEFAAAIPDIDVQRVEVWAATEDPERLVGQIPSAYVQPVAGMDSGWYMWAGVLYIPARWVDALVGYESLYVIRIWGYSPYVEPTEDEDVIAMGREAQNAVIMYVHLEALRMMLNDRNLFTQWQTRSGNTDTSLAGLANEKNIALSEWRSYSRSIARLRSQV